MRRVEQLERLALRCGEAAAKRALRELGRERDPGVRVDPPTAEAKVEITEFGIQHLKLKATATGNNLLFLSETYYQPGWKAFIDGAETEILRANYMFRGLVVPAGDHTIEMRFEPAGYTIGKNLSLAVNLLVIGGMVVVGWVEWKRVRGGRVPLG